MPLNQVGKRVEIGKKGGVGMGGRGLVGRERGWGGGYGWAAELVWGEGSMRRESLDMAVAVVVVGRG